jgi:RND family efflux transporter MFP subunit
VTRRRRWLVLLIGVAVLVAAILFGALPRLRARDRVRAETTAQAIPIVRVVRPEHVATAQDLVLPGNVQAYATAPIFARASGYVRAWRVDIGAHVKKGQLLAEIEIPEVKEQLESARGTLAAAQANQKLADATARRFSALRDTRAVSQQEVDTALGSAAANRASVAANQANVRQLEQLASYARVVAPFDGIITERNVDVGDLINAGASSTPGTALFQIAKADVLRVYVSIPEVYANAVTKGMPAKLELQAHPGGEVTGTLVRTASAIDPTTRTLLAEIQVPNAGLELFSGAFAEVHLAIPAPRTVYTLPVDTLLFRKEGLHVATVVDGKVVVKRITPGRDFGERIEVNAGLAGDELVIESPADSIMNGDRVRVAQPTKGHPAVSER